MKISILAFSLILFKVIIFAQSSVSLYIDTKNPGNYIPDDFSGISLEMGALKSGNGGTPGNMFDDTTFFPVNPHKQVLTIFHELGLKNIRVGGGSVDMGIAPNNADIDAFFRFVKISGVNVIYSVRLLNGSITTDTNIVKYIWNNYHQYMYCFSIGNEPDWHSYHTTDPEIYETTSGLPGTAYPSYLLKWRKFADAILIAEPDVRFGGPNTGSNYPIPGAKNTYYNGKSWSVNFAEDEKDSGKVKAIFFHNYVGQDASGNSSAAEMIDKMLSHDWVESYYPALYNGTAVPVLELGFPYRIAESNSFSGYLRGGSNSFATALFILDYMHWWAEHGAAGVNIHNKQWVGNGPIYLDKNISYQVYPVGYGIAAFNLGGHGRIDSLSITNRDSLNLTAYAVADTNALYVTIINKEHGSGKRDACIDIKADGYLDSAKVIYLNVPDGNVADTMGVLLGGASITNTGWSGNWLDIDSVNSNGYYLNVPASSAAIVRISSIITSIKERNESPLSFKLFQNYPNPFNPTTSITYTIPKDSYTSLKVYDILGQVIADIYQGFQKAGSYKFNFDGSGLSSGVYIYCLQSNGIILSRKMLLLK